MYYNLLTKTTYVNLGVTIFYIIAVIIAIIGIVCAIYLNKSEDVEYLTIFKPLNIVFFAVFGFIIFLSCFDDSNISPWFGIICFAIWSIVAYYQNKKQTSENLLLLTFIQASIGLLGVFLILLIIGAIVFIFLMSNSENDKKKQRKYLEEKLITLEKNNTEKNKKEIEQLKREIDNLK